MANGSSDPLPPFEFLWLRGREFFIKYLKRRVFSKEENGFLLQNRELVRRLRTAASMGDAAGKQQYRELYDIISNLLDGKDADAESSPFARIPDLTRLAQGDIHIGNLICRTARGLGLSSHAIRMAMDTPFRGGIGIFGLPGSGKSWFWGNMKTQLIPALRARDGACTSYIFEGDKATVVNLIYTPLQRAGVESQVITAIAMNSLQVPDRVPALLHAKGVTGMYAEAFRLEQPSRIMIHKAILRLYQEKRLDTQREYFPDLDDLYGVIEKDTSSASARINLLGKLDELFLTFGNAIRYSRGYSCEDFEGHSVILPLAEYEPAHQALIIQHFVCGSFERKVALNDRRPLVASIEEAGALVEHRAAATHERPLFRLCRVGREYNLGFIFLHQHAAEVDPSLISLLHLTLLGNSNGEDLAKGLKAIGCPDAHARWTREHITDFQWVSTSPAIGGHRTPVLIGSLPFDAAPAPPLHQIPNDVLKKIRLVTSQEARQLTVQSTTAPASPLVAPAALPNLITNRLAGVAKDCLIACAHPDRAYKHICQVARIDPDKGSKVLKILEQDGYIRSHIVKTGHKTWYKIASILDRGLAELPDDAKALRESILAVTERGLEVHNHKIRRLGASYFQIAGVRVRIEAKYTLEGRIVSIDVVVERYDGQAEAFEVEQSTDGENSAKKLLALPFTQRHLIAEGPAAIAAIQRIIKPIDTAGKIIVTSLAEMDFSPLPVFSDASNLKLIG